MSIIFKKTIKFSAISLEEEQDICMQILEGNAHLAKELVKYLYPKLLGYAKTKIDQQADAEEIVQDTVVALIDALPLFKHQSSLWTFAVSICRHEIADYFRKQYAKKAIHSLPLIQGMYDQQIAASDQTAHDMIHMVESVYQQISDTNERILRWKYEDNLSIKQIANKLSTSVKAAESKLYRARMAFQQTFIELYGQPQFSTISSA